MSSTKSSTIEDGGSWGIGNVPPTALDALLEQQIKDGATSEGSFSKEAWDRFAVAAGVDGKIQTTGKQMTKQKSAVRQKLKTMMAKSDSNGDSFVTFNAGSPIFKDASKDIENGGGAAAMPSAAGEGVVGEETLLLIHDIDAEAEAASAAWAGAQIASEAVLAPARKLQADVQVRKKKLDEKIATRLAAQQQQKNLKALAEKLEQELETAIDELELEQEKNHVVDMKLIVSNAEVRKLTKESKKLEQINEKLMASNAALKDEVADATIDASELMAEQQKNDEFKTALKTMTKQLHLAKETAAKANRHMNEMQFSIERFVTTGNMSFISSITKSKKSKKSQKGLQASHANQLAGTGAQGTI
jgi:hypothetical protein